MIGRLPEVIAQQRIIPVARRQTGASAPRLAAALRSGGLSVLEITIEGEGGIDAIEALKGEGTTVGAGTVTRVREAAEAVEAGASFLVSPHVSEEVAQWAKENSLPLIPGAFTPTEVHRAWELGVPAVKVFPASLGGPDYLRSLFGPYPDLRLIPTGGIDVTTALSYLDAGAVAVGVGSWLTGSEDEQVVERRASALLEAIA